MSDQAERLRQMVRDMQRAKDAPRARVMTVVSGKGGVGKTSMVVNLAIAFSRLGQRVVVVDADFGFSNVDLLLGAHPKYNLGDVIRGEKRLEEVLETCDSGISYISGGSGTEELLNMSVEDETALFAQLEVLDVENDLIIFDTGAGLRDSALRLMEASDESILVLTPEPTSIMDAFVVMKMAAKLEKKPKIRLLINKVTSEKEAKQTDDNFRKVVSKFLNYDMELMGYVFDDPAATKAVVALVPLLVYAPSSTASRQIQKIAGKFIREETFIYEGEGIMGFFKKLLRRNAQ